MSAERAEEGRIEMRRLLRKKGSVLFLVLVVMSLLIIAASATYYIVNNQHGSVTVRYNSEQSYQTAVSISNTVSKYIDGYLEAISKSGNELDSYKDTIVGKMMSMPIGGTKDITSEIDLIDEGMGKATVTIKKAGSKLEGDNTVTNYEITTTAVVNGETVVVTQVKEIVTGPAEYFTRFLTSTGNRPEDVVFSSHSILSEAYFENEYTSLGAGLAFTHINHSLYSLGTIYDYGIKYVEGNSKEIVVAENYYVASTGGGSLYADNIYVGGNLINGENGDYGKTKAIFGDNVYVLGEMVIGSNGISTLGDGSKKGPTYYVNGDCHVWCGTEFSKFYINGNLYLHNTNNGQGQYHVKGDVIIADVYNGMGWCLAEGIEYGGEIKMSDGSAVDTGSTQYLNKHFAHNASMAEPFDESTLADIQNYISSSTKKNKYQVWDAEQYFNTTFNPDGTLTPIRLDDETDSHVQRLNEYVDNYVVKIDESCMISPAQAWGAGGFHNIFIDTSVHDEDIYIYLQPAAGSDTFSFAPSDAQNVNLYIMGKHSVIFILPQNVNFEMSGQSFVGHIDVFSGLSKDGIDASNIQDGTLGDAAFTGRAFTELAYLQGDGEPLENSLYVNEDGATIFKSGAFGGDAHNNIFLVTKGTKNAIDFSAQSTFLGYVYAPHAIMTSGGGADGLGFIGGLIVGSYAYQTNAALAFTTPYDYYDLYGLTKKTDIVKYLINFANSAGGGGDTMDAAILQRFGTVGYK